MQSPIVVGIDFSEHGRHALATAARLANERNTQLVVVHALPAQRYAPILLGRQGEQQAAAAHVEDAIQESAELTCLVEEIRADGVDVEPIVVDAEPAHLIVETAKARGASMIVVGTHGRSPLSQALVGSVAGKVVRKAVCPVLLVPLVR